MKLAGSSLLYSRLGLGEACDRLAAIGFERVDVGVIEGWGHVSPTALVGDVERTADRVGAACEAAGLEPVAFNVGLDPADDIERRSQLRAVVSLAETLGVEVLTLPAGPADGRLADDLDRFRTLVNAAEGADVTLTVETHWGTHTANPETARRYPEAVTGLGLTLDPGHFAVGPHWPVDYGSLLPAVHHVHARQAGGDPRAIQRPVDAGRVDFAALISELHEANYGGAISVEYLDTLDGTTAAEAEAQAAALLAALRELV